MLLLTFLFLILLSGALVYSILSIIAAFRYLSVRAPALNFFEPVSILKPLAGLDDDLESNLQTFFEQDYPNYEILFAVQTLEDPAIEVVKKLQHQYPAIPTQLVITGVPPYPNAKVFSLDRMMALAKNDLLVMSDSDICVTKNFLQTIAAEFQDQNLALSTCPYRAVAGPSFWTKLEAIGMNTDFISGILVARMLEGMKFAVGPTIAARKNKLIPIGGFEKLKDYLAEDFVMGKLMAEAGHGVILSSYVIEHHIGAQNLARNAAHRLRWVRSTRRSRPSGYIGQLFTMPFMLAVLLVAVNYHFWPALVGTVLLRFAAAYVVSKKVLRANISWLLLPVEDFLTFCFWIAGFFGNTITWRNRRYRLLSDGRFEQITA